MLKREGLEKRARSAHRSRLEAWGDPVDPMFEFDVDHEQHVINLIVAWVEGREPRPRSHWHALEEVGVCTDCDAAAVIDRLEEAEDATRIPLVGGPRDGQVVDDFGPVYRETAPPLPKVTVYDPDEPSAPEVEWREYRKERWSDDMDARYVLVSTDLGQSSFDPTRPIRP